MIDPVAATFERVAAEYDFGRPSWPTAAVDDLGLPRDAVVLDLGAGTGKLTRVLLERFDHVIAVEPLEGMRALIPAAAESVAGTAEQIPLDDESVDAVFCGEAFHWFDWPRALPEIARVLRPGGTLALLWNRTYAGTTESVAWPPGVTELLQRVGESRGENRYDAFTWRDALEADRSFEGLRFERFPNDEEISRQALLARIGSWSNFTFLPADERARLLDELRALLPEPSYQTRLETHRYVARRR